MSNLYGVSMSEWSKLIDDICKRELKRQAKALEAEADFRNMPYETLPEKFRRHIGQMHDGEFAWFVGSKYPITLYFHMNELRKKAVEEFGHPYRCWWA